MLHKVAPNVQDTQPTANSSTSHPGRASGISRPGNVKTVMDSQLSRAEPIRRVSGPDARPPATPPTAPSASSTPT